MKTEIVTRRTGHAEVRESRLLAEKLSASELFRDYEKAFNEATGLPLAIRPLDSFQMALRGKKHESPFCSLMAKSNKSCAACLRMQADLEKASSLKPKTLSCFAGLCDTMVPIRVGERIIAFLQTGQVLLHQPNKEEFSATTRQLLAWGTQVDLKSIEEAYYQTRVLSPEQYNAFIHLLSTFAQHLGVINNRLALEAQAPESGTIARARDYIEAHHDESLSLEDAAKAVNTSVRYFCKLFKEATGYTFTDYLARLRVEKAKNLLQNPQKRISEIAFEVGFESLSQFNRSFKRLSGETPTVYRNRLG